MIGAPWRWQDSSGRSEGDVFEKEVGMKSAIEKWRGDGGDQTPLKAQDVKVIHGYRLQKRLI